MPVGSVALDASNSLALIAPIGDPLTGPVMPKTAPPKTTKAGHLYGRPAAGARSTVGFDLPISALPTLTGPLEGLDASLKMLKAPQAVADVPTFVAAAFDGAGSIHLSSWRLLTTALELDTRVHAHQMPIGPPLAVTVPSERFGSASASDSP